MVTGVTCFTMSNNKVSKLKQFKMFIASTLIIRKGKLLPFGNLSQSLSPHLKKLIHLSLSGCGTVSCRIRTGYNFLQRLEKYNRHHGPVTTVKWLKAMSVALQKYAAGDKLSSLRQLDAKLPFPRLINGSPSFISPIDRKQIREGKIGITRF